jgi:hypothetical protein
MPARSAASVRVVVRPGIMSILPARLGTQKLWMTSALVSRKLTGRPVGMAISLAVSNSTSPAASR